MTARRRAAGAAAVLLLLGPVLTACSDPGKLARDAATKKVEQVDPSILPATLLDLTIKPEAFAGLESTTNAYVDRVGLFGLRTGELLQATLQLSHFNNKARPNDLAFQQTVLNRIGGSKSTRVRMGDITVYYTSAAKQTLAVWFKDSWVYVLAMRDDYITPRNLTRAALDLEPTA